MCQRVNLVINVVPLLILLSFVDQQANEEYLKKAMIQMQIENNEALNRALIENGNALKKALVENENSVKNVLVDFRDEMDRKREELIGLNATVKASNDMDASVLATAKKRAVSEITNGVKAGSKAKKPKVVAPKVNHVKKVKEWVLWSGSENSFSNMLLMPACWCCCFSASCQK